MTTKLEKLTITPLVKKGESYEPSPKNLPDITVLFNPESYSISKSVTWSPPPSSGGGSVNTKSDVNAPIISFGGGGSRQLSLELFFDATSPVTRNGRTVMLDDVREETNKIVELTHIQREEKQSRVCRIFWGKELVGFDFMGVITSLTQKFTQFKPDGKPVRANLSVTFLEFLAPIKDKRKTDPELTTHIVKGGETLSSISAQVYRDPKRWRIIAEANRIDNPRVLAVGRVLTIPKVR